MIHKHEPQIYQSSRSPSIVTLHVIKKVFSVLAFQDMHVIYDVSHNIAKVEEHMVDGRPKTLLVHRKGSTINC